MVVAVPASKKSISFPLALFAATTFSLEPASLIQIPYPVPAPALLLLFEVLAVMVL